MAYLNWADIWGDIWGDIWALEGGVSPPPPVIGSGGYGFGGAGIGGKPRKPLRDYAGELATQRLLAEDEEDLIVILKAALNRIH